MSPKCDAIVTFVLIPWVDCIEKSGMKITLMLLTGFVALGFFSGCASHGLAPVTSGPTAANYDSDFNSNDSMPSAR